LYNCSIFQSDTITLTRVTHSTPIANRAILNILVNYMAIRTILIYIFLVFSHYGYSQSIHPDTIITSNNPLKLGIELIENKKIKEAEKVIKKYINNQNTINEKIKSCYTISIAYNNNLYYNLSLEYAFKGLSYSDSNSYLQTELNHVIIINHIDLKNYDLAESQYWKIAKHQSTKALEANAFNLIGEIYRLRGEYKKSLYFYHKAIKIDKVNSFEEPLAIVYNNIALSHLYLTKVDGF